MGAPAPRSGSVNTIRTDGAARPPFAGAIRRAVPGDAEAIAELFLHAVAAAMPYLPAVHTDDQVRAWIRDVVLSRTDVGVAVEQPALEPIGFVSVEGSELHHLYVATPHQGRGVGSRLLRHAMERSAGRLALYVFERNVAARAFYRARGFAEVERTDGSRNDEKEPDVRCEWTRPAGPAVSVR